MAACLRDSLFCSRPSSLSSSLGLFLRAEEALGLMIEIIYCRALPTWGSAEGRTPLAGCVPGASQVVYLILYTNGLKS